MPCYLYLGIKYFVAPHEFYSVGKGPKWLFWHWRLQTPALVPFWIVSQQHVLCAAPYTCNIYVQRKACTCIVILYKDLLNKYIIFVFLEHKKYSRSFVKLRLNHWFHMDYFNDVLATFLGLGTFQLHCCLCRVKEKILICLPKMNKGLTALEWHEGAWLMIEFSFLGELSL